MKKTEYQQVIEACSSLATVDSIQRKLNKLHSTTEDLHLKTLLAPAIAKLKAAFSVAVSRKSASQIVTTDVAATPFKELHIYCNKCVSSLKPQWQIIAEKNNWRPPSAPT